MGEARLPQPSHLRAFSFQNSSSSAIVSGHHLQLTCHDCHEPTNFPAPGVCGRAAARGTGYCLKHIAEALSLVAAADPHSIEAGALLKKRRPVRCQAYRCTRLAEARRWTCAQHANHLACNKPDCKRPALDKFVLCKSHSWSKWRLLRRHASFAVPAAPPASQEEAARVLQAEAPSSSELEAVATLHVISPPLAVSEFAELPGKKPHSPAVISSDSVPDFSFLEEWLDIKPSVSCTASAASPPRASPPTPPPASQAALPPAAESQEALKAPAPAKRHPRRAPDGAQYHPPPTSFYIPNSPFSRPPPGPHMWTQSDAGPSQQIWYPPPGYIMASRHLVHTDPSVPCHAEGCVQQAEPSKCFCHLHLADDCCHAPHCTASNKRFKGGDTTHCRDHVSNPTNILTDEGTNQARGKGGPASNVPVAAPPVKSSPYAKPMPSPTSSHARAEKCKHPGCTEDSMSMTELCLRHNLSKKCSQDGCKRLVQGGTLFCVVHTTQAVQAPAPLVCRKPDCSKAASKDKQGLCDQHVGKECQTEGCKKPRDGAKFYCESCSKKHNTSKRCAVDECKRLVQGGTPYCVVHNQTMMIPPSPSPVV